MSKEASASKEASVAARLAPRPEAKVAVEARRAQPKVTAVSGNRAARTSVPPSGAAVGAQLERHVGQIRARLELLTSRVESAEKLLANPRGNQDLDGLKRDMVRVAALAERGGAVKDHLNKLTRRVDELEGGARQTNDVAALEGRLSRVARESEGARDRLDRRLEAIQGQLGIVLEQLTGLTERLDDLEGRHEGIGGRFDAIEARLDAAPRARAGTSSARKRPSRSSDSAAGDDLRRIKGIGPKYARALEAVGVTSWAQIAGWSEADVDAAATALGIKPARIVKAAWVAKAQALIEED